MGLGGYLMWTPLAREVYQRIGVKCLPIELKEDGNIVKLIKSEIFENNPHFIQEFNESIASFPIVLNNEDTNYCKLDTPERAIHRYDKHIIHQICEHYEINNASLKCDIFLKEEEIAIGKALSEKIGKRFITIEPHTKDEYTVNKSYPFEKWQHVVNELHKDIQFVQIGQKTDKVLDNCIDMTGKTSFREAASIISFSSLFIGPEGGLMHAAQSVGVESVIIITGFLHPVMTCYPENVNIWIGKDHGPCKDHNPDQIVDIVRERLSL